MHFWVANLNPSPTLSGMQRNSTKFLQSTLILCCESSALLSHERPRGEAKYARQCILAARRKRAPLPVPPERLAKASVAATPGHKVATRPKRPLPAKEDAATASTLSASNGGSLVKSVLSQNEGGRGSRSKDTENLLYSPCNTAESVRQF